MTEGQKGDASRTSADEKRKSGFVNEQEELRHGHEFDEDSPLHDILDSMLFGKTHGILSTTPNPKPIHLHSLTMSVYLSISVE
jgi:hypothetical protein